MRNNFNYRLLILVCLSMVGILAACQSQNALPTAVSATQNPPDASELTPTHGTAEVRRAIISALLALNTRPNQMDVTTVSADGQTHSNSIEFIPPDRKRIVAEGTEIIVAGGKVYLKTASTDPWQEQKIPASTYLGDQPVTEQTIGATLGEVTFIRPDTLDGHPVWIYRYGSTTKSADIELHSQTDLWVGQADGLPYKMVIDGETLAVSLDPSTGENKASAEKALSTTLIVFNSSIAIESPLP